MEGVVSVFVAVSAALVTMAGTAHTIWKGRKDAKAGVAQSEQTDRRDTVADRDALINHVWCWEKPMEALQFWGITLVFFALGAIVFRKLRPHFADVL